MYEKGNNWSNVVKRFKKKHILLNSCNNSEWMNEREQKNLFYCFKQQLLFIDDDLKKYFYFHNFLIDIFFSESFCIILATANSKSSCVTSSS